MRLVVDLQGALTHGSRRRGIGRYTTGLVDAMIERQGAAALQLVLNTNHAEASEAAWERYAQGRPTVGVSRYSIPHTAGFAISRTRARRRIADAIVRRHIADYDPDVVLFTSLFEQANEDFSPVDLTRFPGKVKAVILYDLIPLVFADHYLADPHLRASYLEIVDVMRSADLLLAISQSAREDAIRLLDIEPERVVNISAATDARFQPMRIPLEQGWALASRLGLTRPFVIYVAGADMRKNLAGAVDVFAAMPTVVRDAHQLLLVTNLDARGIERMHQRAAEAGMRAGSLAIANEVAGDDLIALMNMASALVFPSLYEGFGLPVLEAMQCGTPVVAARTSSIPEIVNRDDILYDPDDVEEGAAILGRLLEDEGFRREIAAWGMARATLFTWQRSAALALEAIARRLATVPRSRSAALPSELLELDGARGEFAEILSQSTECDDDYEEFVDRLTVSAPRLTDGSLRRLLVDVSDCRQSPAWSGIQRVVRKLTTAFYGEGCRLHGFVPLAIRLDGPELQSTPDFIADGMARAPGFSSHPVEVRAGDDLFMLDSNWVPYPSYVPLFDEVRRHGGRVFTCIYDIIPELNPEFFTTGLPEIHARWLHCALEQSDGLLCISRAVADEVVDYVRRLGLPHRPGLKIGWFHCGSDIRVFDMMLTPRPDIAALVQDKRPTFLAVGTIEPRKGHALAIDAFELLWRRGVDVNLCFIGARGWKTEVLETRIRTHREHGRRLHWFTGLRDHDVTHAYLGAASIISMSYAEGFGLPIAESARMNRPVICSDIPVFREVGRDGAVYFKSGDPRSLADTVQGWLAGRLKTDPAKVSRSSWDDAARRIADIVYGNDWYKTL